MDMSKDLKQHLNCIEDEASEWLLTLSEEQNSQPETLRAFREWLNRDPLHREVYEKMNALWHLADGLTEADFADSSHQAQQHVSWFKRGLATLSDTFVTAMDFKRPVMAAAFSLLALSVLGLFIAQQHYEFTLGDVVQYVSGKRNVYETRVAEHKRVRLPDGTVVRLGARSKIEINYSETKRRVKLLAGEALFDVNRDTQRPFSVHSNEHAVEALGTVFNVHLSPSAMRVVVVEGLVQVSTAGSAQHASFDDSHELAGQSMHARLVQGEEVVVSSSGELGEIKRSDVRVATAWQQGRFSYIDALLGDVVADLNRYSNVQITLASEEMKQFKYTGVVFHEDVDNWLVSLTHIFPVSIETNERGFLVTGDHIVITHADDA